MEELVDKIISCNIEDIDKLNIPVNELFGLIIISNDVQYKFILNIKSNSDKLLVLGSSSIPVRIKEKFDNRPYFNRVSWKFNQSTLFYDDPTRTIGGVDIVAGWGIGTPKKWYLKEIALIVKKIANILYAYDKNNLYKNIIFYGSSMGGFMSLQLSILVKNSHAIAEIPQLNLMDWSYWHVLKSQLFPQFTNDEIKDKFMHRLSFFDLIIKENYIPNAFLVLDCTDERDFNTQFKKFLVNLDKLPYECNENKIKIRIDGKNEGHKQLGYYEVYDLIENICLLMDNSSYKNVKK